VRPWVLKPGGSLAAVPQLSDWLRLLAAQRQQALVVVPGGGPFADAVRRAQAVHAFGDTAAHRMAVLGMAQYGMMLADLSGLPLLETPEILTPWPPGSFIWLPLALPEGEGGPARDWSHTSDSIALWLARRIGAGRLLLVKSVTPDRPQVEASTLAARGIVDTAFPGLLAAAPLPCNWLGPDQVQPLRTALAGDCSGLTVVLPAGTRRYAPRD